MSSHRLDISRRTTFDVFLSHNSADKPVIRQIADLLTEQGIRVWLDERELVPGRPWQEALEKIIETTRSAAVFVGSNGLGPWEEPEIRACLSAFVDRKLPVIPVLISDASETPKLPLFMRAMTSVDLRKGVTPEAISRLIWGITGKRNDAAVENSTNTCDAAGQETLTRIPINEQLQLALDISRDVCSSRQTAYHTPHYLLTLLQLPDGSSAKYFENIQRGLANKIVVIFDRYVKDVLPKESPSSPFLPFDWDDEPQIKSAREHAHAERASKVTDRHMLLAVLESNVSTVGQMKHYIGEDDFNRLLRQVSAIPSQRGPTPGNIGF